MKIAIISLYSRFGTTTGDMVQADKTMEALVALGVNVERRYLDADGEIYNSEGRKIGSWENTMCCYDIIHAIPPIPSKYVRKLPKVKAMFVASTIFWRSFAYVRQIHKIMGRLNVGLLKEYCRCVLAWLKLPTFTSFMRYDLLLPNSEAEVRNFRAFCRVKKGASILAVPNAIDPIPKFVDKLEKPLKVRRFESGYVLVPGVFAARKNQETLVRAMTKSCIPIVFMGEGEYLEACKRAASDNMLFIPFQEHGSREFYSFYKYARVVCLPSNCETPGIACLEGAALGARPVVPYEGGTCEYYGWDAEYLNPLSESSIRIAVERGWARGRLTGEEQLRYRRLTWDVCAKRTLDAYRVVLEGHG